MAGTAKPKPIDVFEDNIADAGRLVALTAQVVSSTLERDGCAESSGTPWERL